MRINEFANAEEQLALWKLISDSVWTAVRTQVEQQASANSEKAAQAKVTKGRSGKSKGIKGPYAPPPPQLPKPKNLQLKEPTLTQTSQPKSGGVKQMHMAAANVITPNALPTKKNGVGVAQQQLHLPNPQANPTHAQQPSHMQRTPNQTSVQSQKTAYLRRNSGA